MRYQIGRAFVFLFFFIDPGILTDIESIPILSIGSNHLYSIINWVQTSTYFLVKEKETRMIAVHQGLMSYCNDSNDIKV